MPEPEEKLPRVPRALLRAMLPHAERDEVLADMGAEYGERMRERGVGAARAWAWGQVLKSAPSLVRRSWWRGRTGFEPRANRLSPGGPPMESWIMDVRYALRRLRTRPTYALLAVLTLALGVGGTAAVWGIARRLLVDPLPYAREQALVAFWNPGDWSQAEFLYLRPNWPRAMGNVAMYRSGGATLSVGNAAPRVVQSAWSSAELMDVLGVRPMAGRGFRKGDDALGAEPVAVLSYGLWQELGADPGMIGRRLRVQGEERTVVGVMPKGFWFPDPGVRVWIAQSLDPEDQSGNYALVGRLAPGATASGEAAGLRQITRALSDRFQYPEQWDKTKDAELQPLRDALVGSVRPALLAAMAAMAVILLMACANVAALMLGQVDERASELAVRTALGAGRRRLLQQLLAEALVVGVLAGAAGAALAAGGFRVLVGALPLGALAEGATLDWTVFWAAMAIALLASVAVALVPASSLWRGELRGAITRQRTAGIEGRGGRVEGGLVVAEVALAVIMAAGAALLVRSVANLQAIDPGIETRGVAVLDVVVPPEETPEQRRQDFRTMAAALAALPGARSAALAANLPLRGPSNNWGITIEGRPDLPSTTTFYRVVSVDYFRALDVRVLEGRVFQPSDATVPDSGETPVVINEALAKKYFPGQDPLGRRIGGGGPGGQRIIGVVEDVAEGNLEPNPGPARYALFEHSPWVPTGVSLIVRVAPGRDEASILDEARRAVRRVAPGVAVQEATTMHAVFEHAVGPARPLLALLGILAGLALALGAVGIYGVISHFVSRRKREWGIRMALGLAPVRILAQVVGRGGALVMAGAVIGLVAFVGLARLLATFLYGVGVADPLSLAAAAGGLLVVGVVAAFVPARRASAMDPAKVLRES